MLLSESDRLTRGKRHAANRILFAWFLATIFVLGMIGFAPLAEARIDALILIYKTVTLFAGTASLGLYGLDATGMQIIPALKGISK